MKLPVFLTSIALILLQLTALTTAQATQNQANFSSRLFNTIAKGKINKNIIISPASIQTILALAYMGAEGKTADNLRRGLNLSNKSISKKDVAQQFGNLMAKMKDESKGRATLKMANRIYVQEGHQIQTKFNDMAQRYFESGAETVDFADNMNAAQKINNWVEQQTENKIQNMISPNALNGDTAMVLVNSIYLNATWLNDFKKSLTAKGDFHLSKTKTKQVDMMNQANNDFGYAEFSGLDATALSMKFLDTNIQMLVLLPNQLDGLSRLEKELRDVDLTKLLSKLQQETLLVYFPKFKFEFDLSLISTLKTLGMRDLFSSTANFSSLFSANVPTAITEVKHKVLIEIDEKGTEAAGSSYAKPIVWSTESVPPRYDFKVDHPFFFALLDKETVYFTGHIADI